MLTTWRQTVAGAALALGVASAAPATAADKLDLHVKDVDDIAFYAVLDGSGKGKAVTICEWTVNPGCAGSVALTSRLRRGHTQMLVVGLCNKVYRGICLKPGECGKYAGELTLSVNGWTPQRVARIGTEDAAYRKREAEMRWFRKVYKDGNDYGTKELWGIKIAVDAKGHIRLDPALSTDEQQTVDQLRRREFRKVCPQ